MALAYMSRRCALSPRAVAAVVIFGRSLGSTLQETGETRGLLDWHPEQ